MISTIFSIVLKLIEGRWFIRKTQKAGLLFYLRLLARLRSSIIGLLFLVIAFQIFIFSFIGLVLMGIYLAPTDPETKAWFLFVLCLFTFLAASISMAFALSEKTWLKYSGATDLMARVK